MSRAAFRYIRAGGGEVTVAVVYNESRDVESLRGLALAYWKFSLDAPNSE